MANQQNDRAKDLTGYTSSHRAYEIATSSAALFMFTWLVYRLAQSPAISGWWVPLALFIGILAADFVSGFAHWAFDSWGSLDTPVLGKLAIRTFREHHVDQKSITRHDFIETNGHNIGLGGVVSTVGVFVVGSDHPSFAKTFAGMCLCAMAVFVGMTSQIHKWAHQERPSSPIRFLQRMHLILTPEHHAVHHAAPYDKNYCITMGWMNGPLRAIRFFSTLERVITGLTGVIPRVDDIGEKEALAVAEAKEALAVAEEEARAAKEKVAVPSARNP